MTLDRFRPLADQALRPFVRAADRVGLTPNGVSILAIAAAAVAAIGFWAAGARPLLYLVGAAFVFVNGWFDLIDGALARKQAVDSEAGDLLDHVLDRYADILLISGLAAGVDAYLVGLLAITGVLMTSYLGTQVIAVGLDRVYGGIIGRADRLGLIGATTAVTAFVPQAFGPYTLVGWLLVVLAILGHLTAAQRFVSAWRDLT